ncbi:D-2-hydroxyacid dehydrogenase [Schlesneria paludicola]|uniref:D-2-hydroxyacid dehydrogenase n=1 Tax=Schlesneria paludicola TaxID=360056 RepID=UPI00029AB630|nr:D-2-hydroxyacid dehydrogenase [Schlesneria paludicola]
MKLVIFPAIGEARLARVLDAAGSMCVVNAESLERALFEIEQADAFFGKLTPPLLARAKCLRWVQSPTASLEHFLFPELIEHSCVLSNMRGLFSDVVADHVMGFVLCFARNLPHYFRNQLRGEWSPAGDQKYVVEFVSGPGTTLPMDLAHQHLSDCSLGVVGVGHIGSEILRRASAFGMTLMGVDPNTRQVPDVLDEVWPLERLNELLEVADYVVIAAPHTPETTKLFNRDRIRQMKSTGVLINIGRGAIVDLHDLTASLQAQEIGGAALDVCETEPLPSDHPLWRMPNVIITPHVAAASPRIAERHLETLVENVRRFVSGRPPVTQVDKRLWY